MTDHQPLGKDNHDYSMAHGMENFETFTVDFILDLWADHYPDYGSMHWSMRAAAELVREKDQRIAELEQRLSTQGHRTMLVECLKCGQKFKLTAIGCPDCGYKHIKVLPQGARTE